MGSDERSRRYFWLAGKRQPAQDRFFIEALDASVWTPGDPEHWDACWYTGMPGTEVFEQLSAGKFINHIPGNNALTIKSNLHATLAAARDRVYEQKGSEAAARLNFFPRVYAMPTDYHALQRAALAKPDKRWILKPKNSARGKGISIVRDVSTVPLGDSWMVQAYVDNPHTMNGHKYVLRLYVLITCVEPLRVYLFREGSAKLASERYEPGDFDNLYAHLTNPDINATNEGSEAPVVFLSLAKYRAWLREQGHDDEMLFRRVRDLVALTVIAAREQMRNRLSRISADTSGCYELLGIDCLVDAELNPWILECNLSPSMDVCAAPADGGDVEERNKRELVSDMVRLLGLNRPRPDHDRLDGAERVLAEAETELTHAGQFERLVPSPDPARYLACFPLPRLADMVLADAVAGEKLPRPRLRPRRTVELIAEDGLQLYSEHTGELYRPNETAAWIWLKATDGADPDTIAEEFLAAQRAAGQDVDPWVVRQDVWNVLAEWAAAGLLIQDGGAEGDPVSVPDDSTHPDTASEQEHRTGLSLTVAGTPFRLNVCDAAVSSRLQGPFNPLTAARTVNDEDALNLYVIQSDHAYAITDGQRLLADGVGLGRLPVTLLHLLRRRVRLHGGECLVNGALLPLANTPGDNDAIPAVFLPTAERSGSDLLAVLLSRLLRCRVIGGIRLRPDDTGIAAPVGFPLRARHEDVERLSAAASAEIFPARSQYAEWGQGELGFLEPSAEPGADRLYDIRLLVLPRGEESGVESLPDIPDVTPQQALASFLPCCLESGDGQLGANTVLALAQWLEARDLCSVDPGADIEVAAEALHLRIGQYR